MVKVHSHDPWVGAVIKLESTWGTDPGTWGTAAYKVPFTSEDLHLDVEEFPASEEFGALGGLLAVDIGRKSATGSITVDPAYNTKWFWTLFSQAWGTENLVTDRSIWDDTTAVTNLNTHIWTPGTALPTGLSMRVWLGGQGPAGSAYFLLITGLIVTRMVWEQPRNGRARVTSHSAPYQDRRDERGRRRLGSPCLLRVREGRHADAVHKRAGDRTNRSRVRPRGRLAYTWDAGSVRGGARDECSLCPCSGIRLP